MKPKQKFDVCVIFSRSEFPEEIALFDIIKRTVTNEFGFEQISKDYIEVFLSLADFTFVLLQRTNPKTKIVLDRQSPFQSKRYIAETYYGNDGETDFYYFESILSEQLIESIAEEIDEEILTELKNIANKKAP